MSEYKPRKAEVPENKPKKLTFRNYTASMLETKILCGSFRFTQLQGVKMSELDYLFKIISRDYPQLLKHLNSMCEDFINGPPKDVTDGHKLLDITLFGYIMKGLCSELNPISEKSVNEFIYKQRDYCDDIAETNEYIDILENFQENEKTNGSSVITIN